MWRREVGKCLVYVWQSTRGRWLMRIVVGGYELIGNSFPDRADAERDAERVLGLMATAGELVA